MKKKHLDIINNTLFDSSDIEADGPIPVEYSMLSTGHAVFDIEKNLKGTFYANLELYPGAKMHSKTMSEFWAETPIAYEATRINIQPIDTAIKNLHTFLTGFDSRPVFVGFPAPFDHMWNSFYLHKFAGDDPLGFAPFDLKSLAAGMLKIPFRESAKRNFPARWKENIPHNHHALVDAIGQGVLAINMIRENLELPYIPTPKSVVDFVADLVEETNNIKVRKETLEFLQQYKQ